MFTETGVFEDNGSFCAKPWVHLMLDTNGDVAACCEMTYANRALGSTKDKTLNEIWNTPKMMQYRKDMLAGKKIAACAQCYKREIAGDKSSRIYSIESNKNRIKELIANTDENGFNSNYNLTWLDVRFSNKCNFKCRMCGPGSSSAWMPDARKLVKIKNNATGLSDSFLDTIPNKKLDLINGISALDYLKENITNIEKISFAGGEPLIIDEHYELMDFLVANNNFCNLTYHTNLSKLKYKNWNILDYWKKWPVKNLRVWPSIDEIGERAELIRKGTKWADVEENFKILIENKIWMSPHITVDAMNVFRLPEIVTYFYKNNILLKEYKYQNFTMELVYNHCLHISALPDSFKKEIKIKITTFLNTFKDLTNFDITPRFIHVLSALDTPHDVKLTKQLITFTAQLDEIRKEDTYKVIPELEIIKSYTESE
jgi:radical SAM protein with 4Fe4S-binding SPASM domain